MYVIFVIVLGFSLAHKVVLRMNLIIKISVLFISQGLCQGAQPPCAPSGGKRYCCDPEVGQVDDEICRVILHSRLVSVKHNLPSKMKFIIVE